MRDEATYSEPTLVESVLSDGSKVYTVVLYGSLDVWIECVDKQGARDLITVLERSAVDIELV